MRRRIVFTCGVICYLIFLSAFLYYELYRAFLSLYLFVRSPGAGSPSSPGEQRETRNPGAFGFRLHT